MPAPDAHPPTDPTVRIGTLNVRNTADRWRRRRHLLLAQLVELRPDVIGLQELRRWPSQAAWITRHLNASLGGARPYQPLFTPKAGLWALWEGVAILTRLPVLAHGSLDLRSDHRVAGWARLALPGGGELELLDVHLSFADPALREHQARLLLDHVAARNNWLTVVVGDLNARPGSPTLQVLSARLRSAHALLHGVEPESTWPTPLRRSARRGAVLDYVLVPSGAEVRCAWRTFERPADDDPQLFASDHYGVAAVLRTPR